mmetsp:Transcript_3912/g.7525  ORF Transcript_3912/g.7525 Transcript_3912/m.7525 type:complete len:277 (-) Transcript_3912:161-991(-)
MCMQGKRLVVWFSWNASIQMVQLRAASGSLRTSSADSAWVGRLVTSSGGARGRSGLPKSCRARSKERLSQDKSPPAPGPTLERKPVEGGPAERMISSTTALITAPRAAPATMLEPARWPETAETSPPAAAPKSPPRNKGPIKSSRDCDGLDPGLGRAGSSWASAVLAPPVVRLVIIVTGCPLDIVERVSTLTWPGPTTMRVGSLWRVVPHLSHTCDPGMFPHVQLRQVHSCERGSSPINRDPRHISHTAAALSFSKVQRGQAQPVASVAGRRTPPS